MTTTRIITALVACPLLAVAIVFAPVWLLALLVASVAALCAFELGMLLIPPLQAIGHPQTDIEIARRGATVGLPLLLALFTFVFLLVFTVYPTPQLLVMAIVALLLPAAAVRGSIERKMGSLVGIVVSFCCAALPWICVWQLLQAPHRPSALVLLLTLVWVADAAAYFGGKAFGKRALAKIVSPRKTIEGTLCALCSGAVVVSAFAPFLGWGLSFYMYPLVGIGGALLASAGDLLESLYKRFARVSDSGSLLPGHGGLLDCVDGVLLTAPALLLWLDWLS